MDKYLMEHYKGRYRVYPELDLATQDFVRDANGDYDDSFADMYLKCKGGIKIKHGVGRELSCYIPSKGKGLNILRQIAKDFLNREYKDNDKLRRELIDEGILEDVDILDGEVYFIFNVKHDEYMFNLLKPTTLGASISPFSKKNLPKVKYDIPEADEQRYKEIIKGIELKDIMALNREYTALKKPKMNNKMKFKQNIHSLGLWDDYCEFLKERVG